jgi:hypothetical protein
MCVAARTVMAKGRDVMSRGTSSLRLVGRAPAIGAALLVALAAPAAARSATGTPMPAPDDPPPTYRATGTKSAGGAGTSAGTKPARLAESAVPVPTPDAPLVATAAPSVTKRSPAPAPDASTVTPRVASSPTGTAYAGSGSVAAPRAVRSARTVAPSAKPKPVAKRKAKPAPAKAKAAPEPRRAAVPRDAVRLGLPVGVLAPRAPGADMSASLLLAAALLLTGAAAGSLVLGLVARSATRHA